MTRKLRRAHVSSFDPHPPTPPRRPSAVVIREYKEIVVGDTMESIVENDKVDTEKLTEKMVAHLQEDSDSPIEVVEQVKEAIETDTKEVNTMAVTELKETIIEGSMEIKKEMMEEAKEVTEQVKDVIVESGKEVIQKIEQIVLEESKKVIQKTVEEVTLKGFSCCGLTVLRKHPRS